MMRAFTLAGGLLWILLSSSSSAQIVQQLNQVRIGGPVMFGGDEDDLESQMRIEVDAIQRVTGINESAVKKLDVAAKAAIKAVVKKQKEQAEKLNPQTAFPKPIPQPGGLSDEDAEQKNDTTNPAIPPQLMFSMATPDEVKKEDIWQKTLANVLNEEQKQALQTFQKARKDRARSRAVEGYVDQLDSYLMLSDTQRASIIKIVDQKIGENLAKQQGFNRVGAAGAVIMIAGVGGNSSIKPEDLNEVLSAAQMAEMKRQQEQMAAGPFAAMPQAKPAKREDKPAADLFNSSLGFGVAEESGKLVVRSVKPDTPAELAGVQVGDVIDSFDESPVDTLIQLKRAISKSNKGWSMQVRRQDQLITLKAQ